MVVGAASAEIAGHGDARFLDRGFRVVLEQCHRGHDLSGGTEPALRPELLDHGLLHRMQLAVRSLDALDGDDLPSSHAVRERRTRVARDVVEHHGAIAALGMIAAELGAGETELVAQCVDQRFVRQHVDRPLAAIDVERDEPGDRARRLGQGAAGVPDDHVTGGRYSDAGSNDALDELAPRRPKALRRRRAGSRCAGALAIGIARLRQVVL